MNWTTTLPFILDGVDGDLRIEYNPFGQKFYQNGVLIKKKGLGFGGFKYKIETTDGGDDIVKVKGNLKQGRQIVFRGETINLEKVLSGPDLLLSLLPLFAIIFVSFITFQAGFGITGGAILGFSLALGVLTAANLIRNETDFKMKVIYGVVTAVASVVIMYLLATIISLILVGIFGAALAMF